MGNYFVVIILSTLLLSGCGKYGGATTDPNNDPCQKIGHETDSRCVKGNNTQQNATGEGGAK